MNTKSLFYFVEAAKDMNFTHTSKRLYISQQALSQHIGKLESQYGVSLFLRKPQLALSRAGRSLLPYAENLLKQERMMECMFRDVAKQDQGTVRLSVTMPRCSAMLLPVITRFKQEFPKVSLDVLSQSTSQCIDMLVSGEIMLAVGALQSGHPDVEKLMLAQDPWNLLVSDSLLRKYYTDAECEVLLHDSQLTLADVTKLPLICPNAFSDPENRFLLLFDEDNQPNIFFTSSTPQAFLPFCTNGSAALISSRMATAQLSDAELTGIHVLPLVFSKNGPSTSTVCLAFNRNRILPLYAHRLIRIIQEYFGDYNHTRPKRRP